MKKDFKKSPILFAASLLGAAGCCTFTPGQPASDAGNPHQIPRYSQTVTVQFASPEDAAQAAGTIAPLPYGKKAAFTTRWDDSNEAHLKQAQVLAKNGMHGLFLLNGIAPDTVQNYFQPARKLGSVFGNHAAGHALVYHHTPNHLFEAIVIHQAAIESAMDQPSVSFAFPCGLAGLRELYGNAPETMQEIFRRAGILSFPERKAYMQELGIKPDQGFYTNLFTANDRDPDPLLFRNGFRKSLDAALKDPDAPRLTFGIHTWQNEEGFRKLDQLYSEIANRPDFWYCSENQYAAYRYNFYHADVKKISVNGKEATFTISRMEPAFTGSDSELYLNFNVPAVSAGNYTITNGAVVLPESAGHSVPAEIDAIASGEISSVFPGLSIILTPENNGAAFHIRVSNNTTETLKNATVSLILPLRYQKGIHRVQIAAIEAGKTWETTIDAGPRSDDPIYLRDRTMYRVQADFSAGGKIGRLHAVLAEPYTAHAEVVFRDTALVAGPFPKGTVKEVFCEKASRPDRALPQAGNAVNLLWRIPETSGGMPFTIIPVAGFQPGDDTACAAYEKAIADCHTPASGQILIAVDFQSNGAIRLLQEHRLTKDKIFWIDGVRYDGAFSTRKIELAPGKHRMVILAAAVAKWAVEANRFACGILDDATGKPLPCFRP